MAIDKANIQNIYPLTALQEGMMFHTQAEPDSEAYFEQWRLRVRGSLRPDLMRAAWNELFRRHEQFRSIFTAGDGKKPLQLILKQREIELNIIDLRTGYSLNSLERLACEDRSRGFDLKENSLVRLTLVQLPDKEWEIIWSHHHIVLDGWSVAVVQSEFFEIYSALYVGRKPQLEQAPPFSRFVRFINEQDDDQPFWREYLDGFENLSQLPRCITPANSGLRQQVLDLPAELGKRLDDLCRQEGITISTMFQAVWSLLLARYSNSDDVVFGYVFSGRPASIPNVDRMVGLLINTVPVRVRLKADESFRKLLQGIQRQAAELTEHQHTPLSRIQEGQTYFNHIVALENYPVEEGLKQASNVNQTGFEIVSVSTFDRTNYDLDVVFLPLTDSWRIRLNYEQSVYEPALIKRISEQLLHIIQTLLSDPEQSPCHINILPQDQYRQILRWSREQRADYPQYASLITLFEEQSEQAPLSPALLIPGRPDVSYGELQQGVNELARHLIDLDISPGNRIATYLPNSADSIVAILAILKIGCAYVPVDPEYPQERARFILDDSAACAILTTAEYIDSLPVSKTQTVDISNVPPNNGLTNTLCSPDDLAYVIYTSGSTGKPKGCLVTHRNVVRLIKNDKHNFDFSCDDVWVMAHSLCFDFSVWEIYGALLYGARLLIPSRETVRDVPAFYKLIRSHKVSILNQTPLAFHNLTAIEETSDNAELDEHLRCVIFGGDRLDYSALKPWVARYPLDKVALVNMYGITETTVHVSYYRLQEKDLDRPISLIGRPLPNTSVYICDAHLNLQPISAPGEMLVGGSGVCNGYLNQPELSNQRFIKQRLKTDGRLYRSGDLGSFDSEGNIIYLGRNDDQLKIRGHRIEPAEVEHILTSIDTVLKAAVLAENTASGIELVAYLTGPEDIDKVRSALTECLPHYMIPNALVLCDKFPMTANGKLDRKQLHKKRLAAQDSGTVSYQTPQTENEQLLAEIWAAVLGVKQIGRNAQYFGLGGDSIKSIQILARLRNKGFTLDLKDLFRYPRLADLAPRIKPLQKEIISDSGKPFGLTPIQQRFFDVHPIDSDHFNHAVLLKSRKKLDKAQVQLALQAVYEQHSALRTRFIRNDDGSWQQQDAGSDKLTFSYHVVRDEGDLFNKSMQEQTSLDLKNGPLFRAAQYRLADTDRLLLTAHHLAIDTVSWRILQDDFVQALEQIAKGQKIQLPCVGASFEQWSRALQSADFQTELPFWQAIDARIGNFPLKYEPGSYGNTRDIGFTWNETDTARLLRDATNTYQCNAMELILCALTRAYCHWSGADSMSVAMEGHGREAIIPLDISRTVGWFTSLYPLVLKGDFSEIGRQIKELKETVRNVPNGGIGYGILRYIHSKSGLQASPAISFNYLGEFSPGVGALVLGDETIAPTVSPSVPRPFVIDVSALVRNDKLQVSLLFPKQYREFEELKQRLNSELQTVVTHCIEKKSTELTPTDLTYKDLSLDELEAIFDED